MRLFIWLATFWIKQFIFAGTKFDVDVDVAEMTKELKAFNADVTKSVDKLNTEGKEAAARLLAIEQKLDERGQGGGGGAGNESIGDLISKSDGFKTLQGGARSSGRIDIKSFHEKTTIVNATGQNQPLVPSQRVPGIIVPEQRRLTVRDILPVIQATSNLIEYTKELTATNNAGYQVNEGDAKPESAFTYSLATAAVATLAHFLPVSRQLLDDSTMFAGYIDSRLIYLLKLIEENELLNGTGATGHLNGLITQATAMSTTGADTTNDTYIDTVARALSQLEDSELEADAIILNRRDWWTIQRVKTSGGGADNRYLIGNPLQPNAPSLWGVPVVATNAMTQGQFLVGNFGIAAAIYDRMGATVEVSREHSDYFVRNLAAVLCEERLSLVVYRPSAILYCGFPFGS